MDDGVQLPLASSALDCDVAAQYHVCTCWGEGGRGLARPRIMEGAGPDEVSSRRSLFATEQP